MGLSNSHRTGRDLGLRHNSARQNKPVSKPITWKLAAPQFAMRFGKRFFAADAV